MGFWVVLCEIAASPRRGRAGERTLPRTVEPRIVTPEELERERQASRERRQKAVEARRSEQAPIQPTTTSGLSRAQRQKIRDDEYVPPQE